MYINYHIVHNSSLDPIMIQAMAIFNSPFIKIIVMWARENNNFRCILFYYIQLSYILTIELNFIFLCLFYYFKITIVIKMSFSFYSLLHLLCLSMYDTWALWMREWEDKKNKIKEYKPTYIHEWVHEKRFFFLIFISLLFVWISHLVMECCEVFYAFIFL